MKDGDYWLYISAPLASISRTGLDGGGESEVRVTPNDYAGFSYIHLSFHESRVASVGCQRDIEGSQRTRHAVWRDRF